MADFDSRIHLFVQFADVLPLILPGHRGDNLYVVFQAPLPVRRKFLLDILGVKDSALASISQNLWLAVGATVFWLREASPSPPLPQLQALILGMVHGEVACNNQPGAAANQRSGKSFVFRRFLSECSRVCVSNTSDSSGFDEDFKSV